MASQQSAKELIGRIWREKTLDGTIIGKSIALDMASGLDIVSSQLYEKSTRFLLEMLQNADDNSYDPAVTPTLHITYTPGYLRVDCNEEGFSPQNIEAICRIGGSTKKTVDHSTRYIGEKGIGFKSVFKVASVVWISSGNYTFKFDTRGKIGKLGMIAPQWEAFPQKRLTGYTSFLLQLSEQGYEKEIADEILVFEPALLMFLRRVRTIKLKMTRQDGSTWSDELSRKDESKMGHTITVLRRRNWVLQYLVRRHVATNLPAVQQRPSCSDSEMLLAFPIPSSSSNEGIANQKVYAFLPIREYGFRFILQADFLVTASRESIDEDSHWNRALRDAVVDAFLCATDHLTSSILEYQWPQYIPTTSAATFFERTRNGIVQGLQKKRILKAHCSELALPKSLTYIPSSFMDKNGVPFGIQPKSAARYLSPKYSHCAVESILELGVKTISPKDFLQDFRDCVAGNPVAFQSKSVLWHIQLARALSPLMVNPEARAIARKINLVPLENGQWVSTEGKSVFFSANLADNNILEGLAILNVSRKAESDDYRRELYHQLGVVDCDAAVVCSAIAAAHCSSYFDPKGTSRKLLVDHLEFIYKSSWRPPDGTELWFATQDDGRCTGSELYVVETDPGDSPLTRVMQRLQMGTLKTQMKQQPQKKFPFIHQDYATALARVDETWKEWLRKSFSVSTIPRLVKSSTRKTPDTQAGQSLELSDEFRFLFENYKSSDVLWILREYWHYYSQWIEQDYTLTGNRNSVLISRETLHSIWVDSRSGRLAISQTVLPELDLILDSHTDIPILDIAEHRDPRWSILEQFGVSVRRDVGYYVKCLESLQQSSLVDNEILLRVYQQIQSLLYGNEDLILSFFREKDLIYLPSTKAMFSFPWYTAKECIGQLGRVENLYPSCMALFRSLLIVREGNMGPAVTRATLINEYTKLDEIVEIFQQLSDALKAVSMKKAKQALKPLTNSRIFPILLKEKQNTGFGYLDTLTSNSTWFVGDREHLTASLQGLVPLLAFTSVQINSMQDLFRHLDHLRRLSQLVKTSAHPGGLINLRTDYTNFLRTRSVFIERLIPADHSDRDRICMQLQGIKAFVAAEVFQTHELKYIEADVSGYGIGEVALQTTHKELELYMTEECMNADSPSFELVGQLATYCGIQHSALLYTTLANKSLERIKAVFLKEGLHVTLTTHRGVPLLKPEKQKTRYAGSSGEVYSVLSPFDPVNPAHEKGRDPSTMDGIRFLTIDELGTTDRRRARRRVRPSQKNRALPFRTIVRTGDFEYGQDTAHDQRLERMVDNRRSRESRDLQYTGELLTNHYFRKLLGSLYLPDDHWTSGLRTRAGNSETPDHAYDAETRTLDWRALNPGVDGSAFTFLQKPVCQKISKILVNQGYRDAVHWVSNPPTYHFDVAVSAGAGISSFAIDASSIERMRTYQIPQTTRGSPKCVMILVRLTHIYTTSNLDLFVDPWHLFIKGNLSLESGTNLKASLRGSLTPLRLNNALSSIGNQEYSYKPLPYGAIRLLKLLPSGDRGPLRGLVIYVPLESVDDYRTISYVWGTLSRPRSLHTPDGYIKITPSLESALKVLRRKVHPMFLWVDAICINQNDTQELSQQIKLMPRIFHRATSTLAFLGEDPEHDFAIQSLMQIRAKGSENLPEKVKDEHKLSSLAVNNQSGTIEDGKESKKDVNEGSRPWPNCVPPIPTSWEKGPIPPANDKVWESIIGFFKHPWFRRAWVIQEAVYSSSIRIICGKWVIEWNDLFSAIETVDKAFSSSTEYDSVEPTWEYFLELAKYREWEARRTRFALVNLLESFRYAESTRTRDRFFALTALASDWNTATFVADYDSKLEEIVRRFAWEFVKQGKVMLLLYRAGLGSQPERFPSWIPDWTVPKSRSLFQSSVLGVKCAASWVSEPQYSYEPDSDEISIHGYAVDTVKIVGSARNLPDQLSAYLRELHTLVDSIKKNPVSDSLPDLKWKVPIAGTLYPRKAGGEANIKRSFEALTKNLTSNKPSTSSANSAKGKKIPNTMTKAEGERGDTYRRALHDNLRGWRIFITQKEYVGVAPDGLKAGDEICIFDGGAVPFTIRKCSLRAGCHRLVGECYVHGLMGREGERFKNLHAKWFTLY